MKKEKVGFITSTGEIRYIDYYKILEFVKKICQDYCNQSEENSNKFYMFKKSYTKFEPYLDFVLSELNYIMINPLNFKNVVLYNNGEQLTINRINKLKNKRISFWIENFRWNYSCSDSSLSIEKFDIDKHGDGIITNDGYFIRVDRCMDLYHEQVAEQILNQYLIKDKELYLDYIEFIKNLFYFKKSIDNGDYYTNFAIKYLSSRLGHIWYNNAFEIAGYVYNSSICYNEKIISDLKERYPNGCLDVSSHESLSEDQIKKYKKIIERL